jgi:hypothetical protein
VIRGLFSYVKPLQTVACSPMDEILLKSIHRRRIPVFKTIRAIVFH